MSTRVLSKGSVNGISDVYLPDVWIIDVEYLYTVGPCVPIYILLFNLAMSLVVCFYSGLFTGVWSASIGIHIYSTRIK